MEGKRYDAHPHVRSEGQLTPFVLELDGKLQITGTEGEAIVLFGEGSRLRAEIGSLSAPRPTLRLARSGAKLVRRLSEVLARRKLTLLVTRSGVPLVELGSEVRGGLAERIFGMSRVRLYRRK